MPEEKPDIEKPNLEEIASQLANMEKVKNLTDITASFADVFINFPGVKYTDKNGVVHYKTEFTEKEIEEMSDKLFDELSYHINIREYGLTLDEFNALKNRREAYGKQYIDVITKTEFGIDRESLRNALNEKRKNLTLEVIQEIARQLLEHHTNNIVGDILSPIREEHAPYLKEFIDKNAKNYDLDKETFDTEGKYTRKELMPLYQRIAVTHYKEKPKENLTKPNKK